MSISALHAVLRAIEQSTLYTGAIAFYGLYPIITSFIYIVTAVIYYFRRPLRPPEIPEHELPFVSIIVPAYCEESVIERSIEGVLQLDYPTFELIVVNDGSTDGTADKVRKYLYDPRVRLIDKKINEGKAMALNDAILCARAEIILIMDADAVPDERLIRAMVPHFRHGRVGAVAGNPRVRNVRNLLCKLQAVEFSS